MREQKYGLSGEAYESIHELDEFGLIDIHDPMPERRRGKIRSWRPVRGRRILDSSAATPVSYRLIVRDVDPEARALDTVMAKLQIHCLLVSIKPPRVSEGIRRVTTMQMCVRRHARPQLIEVVLPSAST